jgi:transposase
MRPYVSPEELLHRRLRFTVMLEEGYQLVDIAQTLRVDRRSVRGWKAAYLRKVPKE